MSDLSVSKNFHPLLAWLILGLLLSAVLMYGVVPALLTSKQYSEDIEQGYDRLIKVRQAALDAPKFASEYERVRQQGLDKLFYPEGMTAAQVGKELQNQLTGVVAKNQGTMLSSEVLEQEKNEAEPQTSYQQVTVQASFQGSMDLLRDVLHASAQARPLMFVDALEVRPVTEQDAQQVKATVKVSTYWRGSATP